MTTMAFPRHRVLMLALGLSAALAGCSTLSPESRLREGLIDAGLSPRLSACMAERMADRLSLDQLHKLQSLASLRKTEEKKLTVGRLRHKIRALEGPEILAVTSKAALACAL